MRQAGEPVLVKAFVAKAAVEGLDVRVLRGLAHRCDQPKREAALMRPGELTRKTDLERTSRQTKSPRLAPRASFSSRKRSYLLTAILACRSVGRTIGNGGLVTTSLTQRASPPLK